MAEDLDKFSDTLDELSDEATHPKFGDKEKSDKNQGENGKIALVTLMFLIFNPITLGIIVLLIINAVPPEWTTLAIILTPFVLVILAVICFLISALIGTDTTDVESKKLLVCLFSSSKSLLLTALAAALK